jgi:hypothetical protein
MAKVILRRRAGAHLPDSYIASVLTYIEEIVGRPDDGYYVVNHDSELFLLALLNEIANGRFNKEQFYFQDGDKITKLGQAEDFAPIPILMREMGEIQRRKEREALQHE